MEKQLWPKKEEIFGDIYQYDRGVEKRIEEIVESDRCQELIEKAKSTGNTLSLLDDVVPERREKAIPKLLSKLHPFYRRTEYRTKEDYLQYLKQAYGLLLTPMEVPPGRMVGLFFPNHKKTWSPSQNSAQELLKKFYVEVALIKELSPAQWSEVLGAQNPEAAITKMIFKTEFTSEFEEFLRTIPWIISEDVYGAPGLDLVYRYAPGQKMPKKPFGVGEGFLDKLVESSVRDQTRTILYLNDEKVKLSDKKQVIDQIEAESSARLDSFMGISKIERDFVIHQHIIIWYNPGYEKYHKASLFEKIIYAKPPRFLCAIREEALPLDIPIVSRRSNSFGK
ncbi:MAG: hypothetical protein JSW00_13870 [Thermoplasmata archaeon]|nr:MAG: hypothetical protein JSW00_13870 [Thermoplasmata archaeon]